MDRNTILLLVAAGAVVYFVTRPDPYQEQLRLQQQAAALAAQSSGSGLVGGILGSIGNVVDQIISATETAR